MILLKAIALLIVVFFGVIWLWVVIGDDEPPFKG